MAQVAQAVQALGNPPSPIEAQQRARKRHQESIKATINSIPKITITPAKLYGKSRMAYTFSAKAENYKGKVTFNWKFGDGKFGNGAVAPVKHTYAKDGKYVVRVVAYDSKKVKVGEGIAQVNIGVQPKTGAWVLRRVDHKPFTPVPEINGFTLKGDMMNDPSLSRMEALQEVSRGTAKDINTKLTPLLKNARPANSASAESLEKARAHWQKIQTTPDAFGNNTIDPITAERRIRELTGGKGIPEVVNDMGTVMEGLIQSFGAK